MKKINLHGEEGYFLTNAEKEQLDKIFIKLSNYEMGVVIHGDKIQ